jgi:hypothetical protein
MNKKLRPNFTQVPNLILDKLLPILPPGECLCLIFLCRKIYGFHKDSDYVSLSQFEKGLIISKRTIQDSLKELEKKKIILVEYSPGKITEYSINLEITDLEIRKICMGVNLTMAKSATHPGKKEQKTMAKSANTKEIIQNKNIKEIKSVDTPQGRESLVNLIKIEMSEFPPTSQNELYEFLISKRDMNYKISKLLEIFKSRIDENVFDKLTG